MAKHRRAEIAMTDVEITRFMEQSRTATMATIGPTGMPHLVAMWYGIVEGHMCVQTKAKSQKALNLTRDERMACLIEDSQSYDRLRGVSLEGRGVILRSLEEIWAVAVSVWERYRGPYTDAVVGDVEAMMHKRIAVRLDVTRVRSWDHRKLGLEPALPAGTTAVHLQRAT
ncbi:MAG: pyridoxamine 5'-phosphate oxidase family protein [Chloroflexi bacterium]|nr:pyridoxamine 5'-phosphate oxidase family protein [Chloroflexota bacterium]